jgi:UrcA family protein
MNTKTARSTGRIFQLTLGMIGGCLLGATMIGTAAATPVDDAPSIVVKYDARSLATEPGIRELYRRLESAARRVCPTESSRDLAGGTVAKQCRETAVARAIRQINDPRLAEMQVHRKKRG